ncbi:hypothetical protein D3C87_1594050 [compost metagenome]
MTASESAFAALRRFSESDLAAWSKSAFTTPRLASSLPSFSSPASRSARSATIFSASAGRSGTATLYLRPAARSANSRSSTRSSSRGSNSVRRSAASTSICALERLSSAASSNCTVSSSNPGASWLLRSRRRIMDAIMGTGEALPFRNSLASAISPAIRSDFCITARRSASSSSSPSRGESTSSSSTEERR